VALVLVLSNSTARMPNGESIITTESGYNDGLREVLSLTHDGVANFNVGEELDQRQKDDIHRAIKIMDNMNSFRPSEAAGFFEVGLLNYIVGDSDTAKERIQQALNNAQLTPNLKTKMEQANLEGVIADSYHILALIAFDHQDYDSALKEVIASLTYVTTNHLSRPNIYVARARIEVQLKQNDLAQKDLDSAFAMDPLCPQAKKLNNFLHH